MGIRRPARWHWMALALLLATGVAPLAACQTGLGGINVVREAGLASTVAVEISERANKPEMERLRQGTITDPETIEQLVKALDRRLPLGPLADCRPDYRLRFRLADGRAEDFDYLCGDRASYLGGSQPFWKLQAIQPPTEFDALMQRAAAEIE
jgi:hypothetical protein